MHLVVERRHVTLEEEGAEAHCSLGGTVRLNQVVLDWFEDMLEESDRPSFREDLYMDAFLLQDKLMISSLPDTGGISRDLVVSSNAAK